MLLAIKKNKANRWKKYVTHDTAFYGVKSVLRILYKLRVTMNLWDGERLRIFIKQAEVVK